MGYPKDTKFGAWAVYQEPRHGKVVWTIRRSVFAPGEKRRSERYPFKKYKQWNDNPEELKKLCIRLNEQLTREERAKEVVSIKHAYISPAFLEDYQSYLLTQIPTPRVAQNEYQFLVTYFLGFFINELGMSDPLQWHLHHKTKWADYLLSDKAPAAASTKKKIVRAANRFMIYLHEQRPNEVLPLKFNPLSKAMYKKIEADRMLAGKTKIRKFITDEDWVKIQESMPDRLRPFAELSYKYGLRRRETMGLEPGDIRRGYLYVQRQLASFTDKKAKCGPLKGRKPRKVPHSWFSSPEEASALIKDARGKLMHPDSLTDAWATFMQEIGMDYDFHDIRHTWTTKAVRLKGAEGVRDVMLAAGHENIETTMRYLKDDRKLDDDVYTPEVA